MGGTKSIDCNTISRQIWLFCKDNDIWLTCTHIAGKENLADKKSREFDDKLEWKLKRSVFDQLCTLWQRPDIDLFASRLNFQLENYCSWKPDPLSAFIDAFSINWSYFQFVYLFPPFSLLSRCIFKIREDGARGVVIAPFWQTQTWFPRLMQLLTDNPIVLPKNKKILNLPHDPQSVHPLHKKMKLIACLVSGVASENEDFLKKQPTYSCRLGNQVQRNSTKCISGNGSNIEGNLGYSSLNLARGALSSLGLTIDSIPVGRHAMVIRYMKGIFNLRPPDLDMNLHGTGKHEPLLLSYVKPHQPVSRDTISRWIKVVMAKANIDTTIFKAHSVRSASVSKAKMNAVPISQALLARKQREHRSGRSTQKAQKSKKKDRLYRQNIKSDNDQVSHDQQIKLLSTEPTTENLSTALETWTPAARRKAISRINRKLLDKSLTGIQNLEDVRSLELKVDTSDTSLGNFGSLLPCLTQLKLSNSCIPYIRDLGSSLRTIQILWMSRCGLLELDGISSMISLTEVYLSYNEISDISPISMLDNLQILDLEGNNVRRYIPSTVLGMCTQLNRLTLESNPVCVTPSPDSEQVGLGENVLRQIEFKTENKQEESCIPQLCYLDDEVLTLEASPTKKTNVFDADWAYLEELQNDLNLKDDSDDNESSGQ
ncbi:Leucine-rich repeat-containing protein 56 [Mytilus edulis]|uniref:Leucine-rich repeat-containing protein 56 n=1 Tax=Mytilus edulis TaxID=6550 RepID=A0A8S3T790_MYTED|nr:Leucine-rich repeat-containing protein 56 [Mytilus edulis]